MLTATSNSLDCLGMWLPTRLRIHSLSYMLNDITLPELLTLLLDGWLTLLLACLHVYILTCLIISKPNLPSRIQHIGDSISMKQLSESLQACSGVLFSFAFSFTHRLIELFCECHVSKSSPLHINPICMSFHCSNYDGQQIWALTALLPMGVWIIFTLKEPRLTNTC